MPVSRKSALRIVVLFALASVVTFLVLPYSVVEGLVRRFAWIGNTVDFIDTVAPGLEASHLISFAILGLLSRFAWPKGRPRNIAIAIVAVAAVVEIAQIWIPGREAAVSHAVLEAIGGLIGFGIAWVLSYAWGSGSLPDDYKASTHWSGENSDH
jgi:hypothetical protein